MSVPTSIEESALPESQDAARWFAAEVRPHEGALRGFLHSRYPGLADIDDVVQEAFLKTLSARRRGVLVSIRGFLFTVARNTALSFFRRRRFLAEQPVHDLSERELIAAGVDVVESVCSQEELALVTRVLASLPLRCRQIVTLRLLEGLDYTEIAARLGLSEQTVRVQMARGLKRCHGLVASRGRREGTR